MRTINSSDSLADSPLVLTIVGARPQFIKSAALTRALAGQRWTQRLLHAGQHPDDHMGSDFLTELGVPPPDVRLRPRQSGRSFRMADMMAGIAEEIASSAPAIVVVYGDTDATLAGALAAHHAGVPLVHVEAGLRSGDRSMPEELNRILTDSLSDAWITTGPGATEQLIAEGHPEAGIVEAGDVMLDVALAAKLTLSNRFPPAWPSEGPVLVCTLHRPGLVDDQEQLAAALRAMAAWADQHEGTVYFPVHPRTQANLKAFGVSLPNQVVDPGPLGYLDMQAALFHAHRVLTDSGGVQKEAWFQGSGGIVLRDTTEWTELLELGASRLFAPAQLRSPSGVEELVSALSGALTPPPVETAGLFGEGRAAERIVVALNHLIEPS